MKELFRRLFSKPFMAFEILLSSFFISLFTLALPLYIIQILNRYISYGFHGTLITLTAGMIVAALLQLGFRLIRTKLADSLNQLPNERISKEILSIISRAKSGAIKSLPRERVQEALNSLHTLQNSYSSYSLGAVLDAPFSLILICAAFFLSPVLAAIAFAGITAALLIGFFTARSAHKVSENLFHELSAHRSLNVSALNALETVRACQGQFFLFEKWNRQISRISALRNRLSEKNEFFQSLIQTGGTLLSVAMYAVGATFVVRGDLTVGALIGTNILASRAYQNTTKFVQTWNMLNRAGESAKDLDLLRRLPLENAEGSALREFSGRVEFSDVAFFHPGSHQPVFESVNIKLSPGSILAVCGDTGTGKSTFIKLLVTLLDPSRGKILADDLNLAQAATPWWRRQIIYMPQEPEFLTASIRENLLLQNPKIDDTSVNHILRAANLKKFLDLTESGLSLNLKDNGGNLPLGTRRLLSLARAMTTDGQLVLLDDPTQHLDTGSASSVYSIMNDFAERKKTIIVSSNDSKIIKGASMIMDFNQKPAPKIMQQKA